MNWLGGGGGEPDVNQHRPVHPPFTCREPARGDELDVRAYFKDRPHVHKEMFETVRVGLTLTNHISKIASKANSTLGFLRRNLKGCPSKLEEIAYFSMVQSLLEYSCPVMGSIQAR